MHILFLDESGDHNLSIIDSQYPMFVLGGVIIEAEYAKTVVEDKVNAFKQMMFGRTDIILHTADVTRNKNGFEKLTDRDFRMYFQDELNTLMRCLEYSVVACAIQKSDHLSRYGLAALDPYILSMDTLVERFCFQVGDASESGVIVAEKRGSTLDHELELAWLNLKIQGTRFIQASEIEKRISGLTLRSKKDNIAGLQLADLVVSPIGRHLLGKPDREDFRIVESKFCRNKRGKYMGVGLVSFPKK